MGFLCAADGSVLPQTFHDLELVVVADGSLDATRDVLATYRNRRLVVVVNPVRLGLAASRNRGLAMASADLTARQDADDVSRADRLTRQ